MDLRKTLDLARELLKAREMSRADRLVKLTVRKMLEQGEFFAVDAVMDLIDPDKYPADIGLSILEATINHKIMLPSRQGFVNKLAKKIKADGDDAAAVLYGLY